MSIQITKMLEEVATSPFSPTVLPTNAIAMVWPLTARLEWQRANRETLNLSFYTKKITHTERESTPSQRLNAMNVPRYRQLTIAQLNTKLKRQH